MEGFSSEGALDNARPPVIYTESESIEIESFIIEELSSSKKNGFIYSYRNRQAYI